MHPDLVLGDGSVRAGTKIVDIFDRRFVSSDLPVGVRVFQQLPMMAAMQVGLAGPVGPVIKHQALLEHNPRPGGRSSVASGGRRGGDGPDGDFHAALPPGAARPFM